MINNHNFVNFSLTNSDTFEAENYNDLINTLESFVQHTQSIVQIETQRSSRMKNQVNIWRKNARKNNIIKFELYKKKKKLTI